MSDYSSTTGTATPSGHGTGSGGGFSPSPPPPPPPPIVTNQPLLALDSHILTRVHEDASHEIKLVQLEFARDVSALAAAAYGRILDELRKHGKRG